MINIIFKYIDKYINLKILFRLTLEIKKLRNESHQIYQKYRDRDIIIKICFKSSKHLIMF